MGVQEIAVFEVRVYTGTQFRVAGLQPETVDEYVDAMNAGAVFPPVDVVFDGDVYWLADGFHRVEAYRRREVKTIQANVIEGTLRDAMLHAMQANLRHGLRPSRADKRKAVEVMLLDEEWRQWADREIGRRCGVDGKTVKALRDELGLTSPTTKKTMRGGRVVEVETGNIGTRQKDDNCGIPQLTEAEQANDARVTTEPTDKDRSAASKIATDYGWSSEDALVYVLCQKSKRQQDQQRRAERKVESERLRRKVAQQLRKTLPEAKRKRIASGFIEASELARQYGVPTSVVLDLVRADAKAKR